MSARKLRLNGKAESMVIEAVSKVSPRTPSKKLQQALAKVYEAFQGKGDAAHRRDFVFHMTDWLGDLERMAALYHSPENFDQDTADAIVFGFLNHALHHLMASSRLLLGEVRDIFREQEENHSPQKP
jgi:hypothetical protein